MNNKKIDSYINERVRWYFRSIR